MKAVEQLPYVDFLFSHFPSDLSFEKRVSILLNIFCHPSAFFKQTCVMIIQRLASSVLQFFNVVTLSPWDKSVSPAQQVLDIVDVPNNEQSPIFQPPSGSPDLPLTCNYTALGPGWVDCSTSGDRSCWLRGPNGAKYDINTDYEKVWPTGKLRTVWYPFHHAPSSSHILQECIALNPSQYHLNLTETKLAPDGVVNEGAKVFNGQYPGPWIRESLSSNHWQTTDLSIILEACWGDEIGIFRAAEDPKGMTNLL